MLVCSKLKWWAIGLVLLNLGIGVFLFGWFRASLARPLPKAAPALLYYASYGLAADYPTLEKAETVEPLKAKIYGGIVSHHFFVEPEIARFFLQLRNQAPDILVIVGPNHFNAGDHDILVSTADYETPWGNLESDQDRVSKLLRSGLAANEEKPFGREHSISTLVGFIKKVFPKTKIIPIIVKRRTPPEDTAKLARWLDNNLPKQSLVLASVDFSHHANSIVADYHDDKSIAAINSFDLAALPGLEIDSPPSIAVLLKYLESRGAEQMVYTRTNSAEFSGNLTSEDVTSYLFAHFSQGETAAKDKVSLLSFGDLMLGRRVGDFMVQGGDPFAKIKGVEGNFLRGADFIAANLEGPISTVAKCQEKAYSFKFLPETAERIRRNNFNILNLANNHALDCYSAGLEQTRFYLAEQKIDYFGDSQAENSFIVKEAAGYKIAFVGIDTFSTANFEPFYDLIKRLRAANDFVVVNAHWGVEHQAGHSVDQEVLGHGLIDSGADVIIGHHPHVVEDLEIYRNKAIFYSLGNFIFDQDFSVPTSNGLAVGLTMDKAGADFYLFPFVIKNFTPALLPYKEAKIFCDKYLSGVKTSDVCQFSLPALD